MAHSFIESCKPLQNNKVVIHEGEMRLYTLLKQLCLLRQNSKQAAQVRAKLIEMKNDSSLEKNICVFQMKEVEALKPQSNGHFPTLPFSCVDHLVHFGSSSLPMRDYSLHLPPHFIISLFLPTSVPGTFIFIIQVSMHFHFSFPTIFPLSNMFNPFI